MPECLRDVLRDFRRRELTARRPQVDPAERPGAATGAAPDEVQDEYLPYGVTDERSTPICQVLATLGPVELEYAAIRRGCGLMPAPHRSVVRVSGPDARAVVDGVVTNAVKDIPVGASRSAFLLDRKGRVQADLLVAATEDGLLIDTDACQNDLADRLDSYVFTEDVKIEPLDEHIAGVWLEGPAATVVAGIELEDGGAGRVTIDEIPIEVIRHDQVGVPGLRLFVPTEHAVRVVRHLLDGEHEAPVRPIGWHAWNIARIEAGTPLFNIDFGTHNLPHESGCLASHVSFRKGCYPGQEVVARIENLGQPKQRLVGIQVEGDGLPVAGAELLAADADPDAAESIGMITSSAVSPMLGARPVAFAVLRSAHAEAGTRIRVPTDQGESAATVTPLQHWPVPGEPA